MEHSLRLVILSTLTVLLAILISSAFFLYRIGQESSTSAVGKFAKSIEHGLGPDFEQRDGSVVDGDFVRETIEEYAGQYFIRIRTAKHPESFAVFAASSSKKAAMLDTDYEQGGSYAYAGYSSVNDSYYIDGAAKFYVTAIYDESALTGVYFEQLATTSVKNVANVRTQKRDKLSSAKGNISDINSKLIRLRNNITNLKELTEINDKNTVADRNRKFAKSEGTVYSASKNFNSTYSQYLESSKKIDRAYDELLAQFNTESWRNEVIGDVTRADVHDSDDENDPSTLNNFESRYENRDND